MTLIITHISRFGIVHASDSNLADSENRDAGTGQKTYLIPSLNSGLTVAGNYSVSGCPMDSWMNAFIAHQSALAGNTLYEFGKTLKKELQSKMKPDEKASGCIMHLSGYVEVSGKSHPEFYHIRNVHKINAKSGRYEDIDENFEISEDFWNRDCKEHNLMAKFKDEKYFVYQLYMNGYPSGRICYNIVTNILDNFFQRVWAEREWRFRPPNSLDEVERLVKLYMQVINDLFILSDYDAHYIGGRTQTHMIPQPANIVETCL